MNPTEVDNCSRIDRWLWAVRIFKTRALAADACRAESVEINERPAKPSREVHVGEIILVHQGLVRRTLFVRGVPLRRVGAKLVEQFFEDKTPPEEFAKAREHRVQQILAREKGSGRPTKRDRREHDQMFE